jgi:zinc protease
MPHRLFRFASLLAATLLAATLPAALPARAALDLAAPIPPGSQVKIGKLANGLTYYIQHNERPAGRLELRLVVKAGSVLEDDDQQGLAHFVEHMAFDGSTHFEKQALVNYLQGIGVNMGADLNAYTSYDETVYILPVPTAQPEHVDQAFTILEDWAHGVRFDPAAIDKERTIVLEELRLHQGVGERVNKVLNPQVYNGARYAWREPIGQEDVIRNFRPEALRRFYRDWYRPDLMAVVAVGDIDPLVAERQIRAHFGGLANPAPARERPWPEIAARSAAAAVVATDDELTGNVVTLHYPVRYAPDPGTYGSYRDDLIERLFRVMLQQRLAELEQQPAPPVMGAAGGLWRITPRHREFFLSATVAAGGTGPAIAALVQERRRLRQDGFSAAELERARKIVDAEYERYHQAQEGTYSATFAAEAIRNFLAKETMPGVETTYRLAKDFLPAITLADVNAFARSVLPADGGEMVAYVGAGKGGPRPDEAQLLAELAAAAHAPLAAHQEKPLAAHQDKAVTARLMARPSAPARVVEESRDDALGVTRLTLSNGVKVILKPTPFNKEQVLLSARRDGGQLLFDRKDRPNARYAAALVAAMGIGDFAPLDLNRVLAGREVSVDASLSDYSDDVNAWCGGSPEDIETMLQMLTLRLTTPRRDPGLYRTYMDKQAESLRNRDADPDARFDDAVTDSLYGKHPFAPHAFVLADAAGVDLDRSLAIYRERFSSAKGMTFILVGAFEVERIKPLLAAYLGTLPTPDLPLGWRDAGVRMASGVHKADVQGGTAPRSALSLTFSGPVAWSPAEVLRMEMLVEVMNLRVFDVLREKLGLIYAGGMTGGVYNVPNQFYSIGTTLQTGPEKVERLVAALFAECERMKREGPDPADLEKVKQNWRLTYRRSLEENAYWLDQLQTAEADHYDPHRILGIMDEAEALTPADIRRAAQLYFNTENYVQVVLNPRQPALAHAGAD